MRDVTSGVPQGTVLGPLLFLIYANYIAAHVSCEWLAFADDFKLGMFCKRGELADFQSAVDRLQVDLDSVVERSSSWNLRLNADKCVVMRFGGRSSVATVPAKYSVNGRELAVVSSYRDLGVIIDPSLKFHLHVNSVVGKAGSLMGDLLRSTVCRAREFMVTLFTSHIRPLLDYCSCVWNVGYLADVRRLESVQRRWTREVAGVGQLDYVSRLRTLGLFSIGGRFLRADLIKLWKVMRGSCESW